MGAVATGTTSATSTTATGLTAGTAYDFYVRSNCGGNGESTWTGPLNFNTPPANDLCDDAIDVTANVNGAPVAGTTVGSTFDNVGTCGASNTSPGVWYKFTATGNGQATVSTCGAASFDTKLSVFTGTCASRTCVGGNDDFTGCTGSTSQLSFATTAGTTYYILVHGFNAAVGTFNLTVTQVIFPEITVAAIPASVLEDADVNSIDFVFSASVAPASDLTVSFTVGGTATYNEDYIVARGAASFTATTGTVVIPAGQTQAVITVQTKKDSIIEPDETIILTLQNP